MAEVIKDTFETRMKIREFDSQIKKLEERVEMIEAVKDTLPESMQDVALEAKEILIKSLIATTSIKGAFLTMLTTQKSEFKVSDPRMRRQIAGGILRGNDEGGF